METFTPGKMLLNTWGVCDECRETAETVNLTIECEMLMPFDKLMTGFDKHERISESHKFC